MNQKKCQITVIELSLIALLFSSIFIYVNFSQNSQNSNYYQENLNSQILAITKNNELKQILILENLSQTNPTQNWSQITTQLNKTLKNYELKISNITTEKTIQECEYQSGKTYSQILISSSNLTTFNNKILTIGVCY